MSYSKGNLDLSNVYNNRININEIVSSGLKLRSKYIIANKDLSVASDVVGTVYLCQQGIVTTTTGAFTSTTVTVATGLGLTSGMFINVVGSVIEGNNNIFEINTYISGTGVITIKTTGTQFFCKTSFTPSSVIGATVSNVTLFVAKIESGVYSTTTASTSTGITYSIATNNSAGSSTNTAIPTWNGTSGSSLNDSNLTYTSGILSFPASNSVIRRGTNSIIKLFANDNLGIGTNALNAINTGTNNIVIITNNGGIALTNGSRNLLLGENAGSVLTTENDNILLYNTGTASVSGRIAIGTSGTHTTTFIAGITGVTPSGATSSNVIIDSNGQLGTGIPTTSNKVWGELVYQGATTSTTTNINLTLNLYTELDISGTVSFAGITFNQPNNGRLRYTGTATRTFLCLFSFTGRLATSTNKSIAYELRTNVTNTFPANGTTVSNSGDQSYYLNNTLFTPSDNSKVVTLNQNDTVSICVSNRTDNTDINVYMIKIQLFEI